jgi:hypothetical protein
MSQIKTIGSINEQRDIVSTPEGDNEFAPDQPVGPVEGIQVPLGGAPNPYDADPPDEVEETVDKLSVGQILT